MASLDQPLWDGNGGTLDPKTASQRDLLVALHFKVDRLIDDVRDHERRIRRQEDGELTRAQKAAFEEVVMGDKSARRAIRMPALALLISLATFVAFIVLAFTGHPSTP